MFNYICSTFFGTITTLDISALIAFTVMLLMVVNNNNKRFKKKADKSELEKLGVELKKEVSDSEKRSEEQRKAIRENYLENIEQVNRTMGEISKTQTAILNKVLKIK